MTMPLSKLCLRVLWEIVEAKWPKQQCNSSQNHRVLDGLDDSRCVARKSKLGAVQG